MNQRNELIKTVEANTNTIKEFINYQKQQHETNFKPFAGNWNRNRNVIEIVPFKKELFPRSQYLESISFDKFGIEQGNEISK